jgi:hypothetical protein
MNTVLLGCKVLYSGESLMFWWNILTLFFGMKSMPSKKAAEASGNTSLLLLVFCLVNFLP